jgi:hypothetical protein
VSPDFGDKEFDYGVGYPTPFSIPDDTSCWTIPVPNDGAWQAILLGLLQTLVDEGAWQQYEGAISQEEAAARWSDMFEEFLFNSLVGCGATPPPGIRYNPDDDDVEIQEPDGTWVANPAADPRHSLSNEFPPLDSDDPRCDAAANMVAWLHSFVDTLQTVKDETGIIASFFLDVLEILWGAGIFLSLITLLVESLLFIGLDAVLDAFTDMVYDQLLCIFDCNIGTDGSVSAVQLTDINTAIDSEIGGTAATVLHGILFIMGEVGLSNVGATGTQVGSCNDCGCGWHACFPVSEDAGIWSIIGSNGEYSAGFHVVTVFVSGNPLRPRRQVYITTDLDSCTLTKVKVTFSATYGDLLGGFSTNGIWVNNFGTQLAETETGAPSPVVWSGTQPSTVSVQLNLGTGASDSGSVNLGDGTITFIDLYGDGDPPSQVIPYLC